MSKNIKNEPLNINLLVLIRSLVCSLLCNLVWNLIKYIHYEKSLVNLLDADSLEYGERFSGT